VNKKGLLAGCPMRTFFELRSLTAVFYIQSLIAMRAL